MQFRIADSFTKALGKLNADEQKAVKITVFDLQQDPANPGLQFHRIENSKDKNFWSMRVSRDIRLIIHKTAASFLICYVDHHDDAYSWAERRRIETHPKTGAAQIVEVRERVEEIAVPMYVPTTPEEPLPQDTIASALFRDLKVDDLLDVGVPQDWLNDVQQASEERFFELADHIPDEAAEALLNYAATGRLHKPEAIAAEANPFEHPDAQRRFRVLENKEELERALDYPWDQWTIFLHPSQRHVVEQSFSGPARVSGSAGTGKTVVALHRAANILNNDSDARVLLTTFSSPLANALKAKVKLLTGVDCNDSTHIERYLWQRKERLEHNQKSPQDGALEFLAEMIHFQENEADWLEDKAQPSDDLHASITTIHQKLEAIEASLKPKKERAPRQDQLAKARCQAVAKYLWQANPEMTIAEVASHEAVYNLSITNGKRYEARTVRDWIAEVDPRPPEKKIGRPRKAAS